MNEFEIVSQLMELPVQAIFMAVIALLWRKIETIQSKCEARDTIIQTKYQSLLVEMGELRGRLNTEIKIEEKIEQLLISKA